MQCEQAEILLAEMALGSADADAQAPDEFNAHIASCESCRQQLSDMRVVTKLVREGVEADESPVLSDDRMAALLALDSPNNDASEESLAPIPLDQADQGKTRSPWALRFERYQKPLAVAASLGLLATGSFYLLTPTPNGEYGDLAYLAEPQSNEVAQSTYSEQYGYARARRGSIDKAIADKRLDASTPAEPGVMPNLGVAVAEFESKNNDLAIPAADADPLKRVAPEDVFNDKLNNSTIKGINPEDRAKALADQRQNANDPLEASQRSKAGGDYDTAAGFGRRGQAARRGQAPTTLSETPAEEVTIMRERGLRLAGVTSQPQSGGASARGREVTLNQSNAKAADASTAAAAAAETDAVQNIDQVPAEVQLMASIDFSVAGDSGGDGSGGGGGGGADGGADVNDAKIAKSDVRITNFNISDNTSAKYTVGGADANQVLDVLSALRAGESKSDLIDADTSGVAVDSPAPATTKSKSNNPVGFSVDNEEMEELGQKLSESPTLARVENETAIAERVNSSSAFRFEERPAIAGEPVVYFDKEVAPLGKSAGKKVKTESLAEPSAEFSAGQAGLQLNAELRESPIRPFVTTAKPSTLPARSAPPAPPASPAPTTAPASASAFEVREIPAASPLPATAVESPAPSPTSFSSLGSVIDPQPKNAQAEKYDTHAGYQYKMSATPQGDKSEEIADRELGREMAVNQRLYFDKLPAEIDSKQIPAQLEIKEGFESKTETKRVARRMSMLESKVSKESDDLASLSKDRLLAEQANNETSDPTFTLPPSSQYPITPVNPFVMTTQDHLSTFAIDVDTASYTLARRFIRNGYRPPVGSVRSEEFINAFDYNHPTQSKRTFAVHAAAAAPSPFGQNLTLIKVGVKARVVGRDGRKPAHLTLVVDASGSMDKTDRLPLVKHSLKLLVDQLHANDSVTLITYGTHAQLLLQSVTASNKTQINQAIDTIQTAGSTNMIEALTLGYQQARAFYKAGHINRVMLCSDGVANIGDTDAQTMLAQVDDHRRSGITFTSVGFGMGAYNDALLEKLANRGDGFYAFVDSKQEAHRLFVTQLSATLQTVAKDAKIQVDFDPKRVRRYRLIGYENRDVADKDFRNDSIDAGEVGSGQSATALYEVELIDQPQGQAPRDLGAVYVRYQNVDTEEIEELSQRLNHDMVQKLTVEQDPYFYLAACVGEFAEQLRSSAYAAAQDQPRLLQTVIQLSNQLPLNDQIRELQKLIEQVQGLPAAP